MPNVQPVLGSQPIIAAPTIRDPLRNFVFRVDFIGIPSVSTSFTSQQDATVSMGFISVSGQGITTEMIPYREGGDNTMTRKMPGQSEVGPLQLTRGVFISGTTSPMYQWYKRVFSVVWGKGELNASSTADFRCDVLVRVLRHPVTQWAPRTEGDPRSTKSTGMLTRYINCWPGQMQWNDLNAGDNSVMVETMTLHHEGFVVYYGTEAQGGATSHDTTLTS
jgi:phage tail-like protein